MDELEILQQGNTQSEPAPQTPEEEAEALRVQHLFRQAWDAKQALLLNQLWGKCDDYKHGRQNPKQSDQHPGSVTNVIHRVVENQISDLLDKPYSSTADGREPGDDMFAEQAQHVIDFILDQNKLEEKLNYSEHDRLELGTTWVKVYYDEDGLEGKGLPRFDIISPANAFPDPKVQRTDRVQEGEFFIHALPKPLSWLRRQYKKGKYVQREVAIPYNPQQVFSDDRADEVHVPLSEKALLLECYIKDSETGELYCLHVAGNVLLEDSRKTGKKVQRRDLFPLVAINCYTRRGTIWGMGDVELLMPLQDLINELDDQIRMNARMSGNPQIAVGRGAGKTFDFGKWTNAPGLRIPMVDHTAFKVIEPVPVSRDVPVRREKAFQEIDLISGVQDVSRGNQPGGVTAAAAINQLTENGQKMVVHKNKMFTTGWSQVLSLLFDEVLENWNESMWVRINGEKPDWTFIDMNDFKNVNRMIPNEMFGAIPGQDEITPLTDEEGNHMKRDAMFDFKINMGNGFPNDKTFLLQMLTQFAGIQFPDGPLITRPEFRKFIRENMGIDLDDEQQAPPPMIPGVPPGAVPPPGMGAPPLPPQAPPVQQVPPIAPPIPQPAGGPF